MMHPLLFSIGSVPFHTYGLMIAIGFMSALLVMRKLAQNEGLDIEAVIDLAFLCLFSGLLGARILFILTRWSSFASDPAAIFKIWEGGLVFYGGPIAAIPVVIWFTRRKKMNLWKVGDICAPALTLAHMFGRIGCFAAGCCYGKPTTLPLGVHFHSSLVDPALRGVPLHPTQLYEAFSLSVLFFGLCFTHQNKKFDGQVMLTYFMAYPLIRSLIEIFRGDLIRGFVMDGIMSTSQFISVLVFLAAGAVLVYRLRNQDEILEAKS